MKTKKVLSTIALLVCMLTLLCAPTYAYAATSQPVLIYSSPGYKYFEYQPSPLFVPTGEMSWLTNNDYDGAWYVQAGQQFFTHIELSYSTTYQLIIYNYSTGQTVVSTPYTSNSVSYGLRALDSGFYTIMIQPLSDLGAMIQWYCVSIE